MIAKRYLALLTGVAMATSTVVAPANAVETETAIEGTVEITADNGANGGDVDADLGADVDADTDATEGNNAEPTAESEAAETPAPGFAVQGGIEPGASFEAPNSNVPVGTELAIAVTDKDGNTKANDGWTAVRGGTFSAEEIKVTAPQTARKGDIAVVTATHEGRTIGTVTVTVQSDGEIPLGFNLVGDVLPGVESTWDVNVDEGAELKYFVRDADGNTISHENWDVTLVDGVLAVTAPANAREGDRVIITAQVGDQVVGKAEFKVSVDGIQTDLRGDIPAGATTSWPTSISGDTEIIITITDEQGRDKSSADYNAEIHDGELHITVPSNAAQGDRVMLDIRQNDRTVGKADLRVVTSDLLFDISGDVLAGEESYWDGFIDRDDFNVDALTLAFAVYDADGIEKSKEGWDVQLTENGLFVTPPADANENDRVVISARTANGEVVGKANLRVIAKAEEDAELVYDISGDILPGVESFWDNIDLPDHQPEFEVFDRDGNKISSAGWIVTFEDGVLRVTAPDTSLAGDVVKIVSKDEEGNVVGKARLKVVVDGSNPRTGDGSSAGAPWWAVLLPILGVAGVIALLTGGSSLSSGSSLPGSSDDSDGGAATGDNGGANNGGGAAEGAQGEGQTGTAPATGPVAGQDVKAVAQAQAANAPAAAPAAATQQQPAAKAAEKQGALANTGVQNTLIALVVGLLAAAAGVFLLASRRRNI